VLASEATEAAARPVLVKSVSFPFLCEPRDPSDAAHLEAEAEDVASRLWNDFVNAPETKIGGSGSDSDVNLL
jgi:hypothetical protein